MKDHSSDLEQDENEITRIVRRWSFICKKLEVVSQKLKRLSGQKNLNVKLLNVKSWLTEAELFMKSHSKEERTSQEIMKIKVNFFNFIYLSFVIVVRFLPCESALRRDG